MPSINPYQSPEETSALDHRAAPENERGFGFLRMMVGVWSPCSLSKTARRSSTGDALAASSVTLGHYCGVALGVIVGCGVEPFRGWTDCLLDIAISAMVATAVFVPPFLVVEYLAALGWRAAGINEYYFRLLLIWPLAFRLPYVLLCTALFFEIARDPSFEFMEIEKPFFVSYEYAMRFAGAGIALGSIFAVLLVALPIRMVIGGQVSKRSRAGKY